VTVRGAVRGFLAGRPVAHDIAWTVKGWSIDGRLCPGLGHLADLDFGFTPATNLQQLRRVKLGIGDSVELPVAWLEAGSDTLVELPQRYRRLDETRYAYEAPGVPYAATLEIAANGFAAHYPDGWVLDGAG